MKQQRKPPPPTANSDAALVWSITWIQAFPTMVPNPDFILDRESNSNDPVWQLLAFDAIFALGQKHRLQEEKWKHTRDQASMEKSLGYGEITIPAVAHIMERLLNDDFELFGDNNNNNNSSSIVMDLGSGNGRVLLAACLAYSFDKAIGLEIVPELHEEALQNWCAWNNKNHLVGGLEQQPATTTCTIFDFRCADFRDHANLIATANLIFIHATVFNDLLMAQLQTLCEACSMGTYFVMVTRPLLESSSAAGGSSSGIQTLESLRLDMNWGEATVYIQKKVGLPLGKEQTTHDAYRYDDATTTRTT